MHLSPSLGLLQAWQAPGTAGHGHDWDFGSSPTLFGSLGIPPDVGACNKNGIYYALADNPLGSSPLWTVPLGVPGGGHGSCLSSAVWDGPAGTLYLSGNPTTIGGTSFGGSVGPGEPVHRRVPLAHRAALRGDGHAVAGQRRRARGRPPTLHQAGAPRRRT